MAVQNAPDSYGRETDTDRAVIDDRVRIDKALLIPMGETATTNDSKEYTTHAPIFVQNNEDGIRFVFFVDGTWIETANMSDVADAAGVSEAELTVILEDYVLESREINGHALTANITLVKADIGLGLVDNTADASKPVSAATQTALDLKVNSTLINANNGVAPLDAGGKIPLANLPSTILIYKGVWDLSTNTPTLTDGTGTSGFTYRVTGAATPTNFDFGAGNIELTNGDYLIHNGTVWEKSDGTDAVTNVNGQQGLVDLDADDIDDTSTTNKFVTAAEKTSIADSASGLSALSADNSEDVTLAGENYLSIAGQVITANAVSLAGTHVTGTLPEAKLPTGINANKLADGSVSNAELQFIGTLTSNAQTQLDSKVSDTGDTMTGPLAFTDGSTFKTVILATGAGITFANFAENAYVPATFLASLYNLTTNAVDNELNSTGLVLNGSTVDARFQINQSAATHVAGIKIVENGGTDTWNIYIGASAEINILKGTTVSGAPAAIGIAIAATGDIRYAADFAASYTTRSLVDKAYVDSKVVQTITDGVTDTAPSQDIVFDALALKANAANSALTGTPTAPTAATTTNTTQIATTAFSRAQPYTLALAFDASTKKIPTWDTTPGQSKTITASQTATLTLGAQIVNNIITSATYQIVIQTRQKVVCNRATLVTLTLPTTADFGDEILITGMGAGGWRVSQNAGDTIHGPTSTTTGTGGFIASAYQYDCVMLVCVVANSGAGGTWVIQNMSGTITIS